MKLLPGLKPASYMESLVERVVIVMASTEVLVYTYQAHSEHGQHENRLVDFLQTFAKVFDSKDLQLHFNVTRGIYAWSILLEKKAADRA